MTLHEGYVSDAKSHHDEAVAAKNADEGAVTEKRGLADAACASMRASGYGYVAPTTAAPVTEPPTTAAPVTAAPTTAAPVTAAPTTAAPTTTAFNPYAGYSYGGTSPTKRQR